MFCEFNYPLGFRFVAVEFGYDFLFCSGYFLMLLLKFCWVEFINEFVELLRLAFFILFFRSKIWTRILFSLSVYSFDDISIKLNFGAVPVNQLGSSDLMVLRSSCLVFLDYCSLIRWKMDLMHDVCWNSEYLSAIGYQLSYGYLCD